MKVAVRRNTYLVVTCVIMLAATAILLIRPLDYGIDFTGGSLIERAIPGQVSVEEVRAVLAQPALSDLGIGSAVVQPIEDVGQDAARVFLIRAPELESDEVDRLDEALEATFGGVTVRRTEVVGPVIGAELLRRTLIGLVVAGLAILAYITFRFEGGLRLPAFGLGAVIALAHDVLVTLAVLSLTGFEVNAPFIAAILTVVGYSINDTIVIFDRIRENMAMGGRSEPLRPLVDKSLRQSLTRSINTSVTTVTVLVSLYWFGGATLRDFTLTLIVGIAAGAFSSLFIATPVWLFFHETFGKAPRRAAS